ncbi:hypothetical protein ES705_24396 [subsurface metagenome]
MDAWAAVDVGDPAPDPCDPPPPPLSVYITGPQMLYYGDYGTWVAHPSGGTGTYSYDWYVDNGWGWEGPYGHQASYTDRMMPVEDWMELRVDVTSGEQQESGMHLVICMDCFGGQMSALIYPNPAEDFLNVIIEDKESEIINSTLKSKRKTSKFTNGYSGDIIYTIYNNYGQNVFTCKTKEKQIRINTADLPKGHYVLKIIYNDSLISKQIMIK